MNSILIEIKKPTGEEDTILHRDNFADADPEKGFKFEHKILDDWNVDNLLVTIKAEYVIRVDYFVSWEMPVLTNKFALTITYPKHLKIVHMPYLISYDDCKVTEWQG
ncbi:MAG TPA: hypothetical protein ENO18_07050, partial [Caldithrix sp.]|nr:hypothetical protein [Caldithrix sp.]